MRIFRIFKFFFFIFYSHRDTNYILKSKSIYFKFFKQVFSFGNTPKQLYFFF